ncbi:21 kDa protein-like [Oryza glaberrima]|uniref:21 kDa protein-like n=1 Tax=Oryza glaberrima TaxID=4538 RepID=UPI00224C3181|nr:21 kDa protein-like [Oryza glaberrima]
MARSLSLLLLLVACFLVAGATAARPAPSTTGAAAMSSFVRTWCAGTEYPALCDATLAPYSAAVGTSPAKLAWAALTVTLSAARNATSAVRSIAARSSQSPHLPPVAAEAAGDCASELGDGVDALRRCVDAMARVAVGEESSSSSTAAARRKARFEVDNVRTWASAALTDDNMCMEGFKGEAAGGGGAREAVRGHIMGLLHLTANALGILNAMAKQI